MEGDGMAGVPEYGGGGSGRVAVFEAAAKGLYLGAVACFAALEEVLELNFGGNGDVNADKGGFDAEAPGEVLGEIGVCAFAGEGGGGDAADSQGKVFGGEGEEGAVFGVPVAAAVFGGFFEVGIGADKVFKEGEGDGVQVQAGGLERGGEGSGEGAFSTAGVTADED